MWSRHWKALEEQVQERTHGLDPALDSVQGLEPALSELCTEDEGGVLSFFSQPPPLIRVALGRRAGISGGWQA